MCFLPCPYQNQSLLPNNSFKMDSIWHAVSNPISLRLRHHQSTRLVIIILSSFTKLKRNFSYSNRPNILENFHHNLGRLNSARGRGRCISIMRSVIVTVVAQCLVSTWTRVTPPTCGGDFTAVHLVVTPIPIPKSRWLASEFLNTRPVLLRRRSVRIQSSKKTSVTFKTNSVTFISENQFNLSLLNKIDFSLSNCWPPLSLKSDSTFFPFPQILYVKDLGFCFVLIQGNGNDER